MALKRNKKKQQPVATSQPLLEAQSMALTSSSQSIAFQPTTSPYTSDPVALRIGPEKKTYYVPQDYLKNLDSITSCRSWDGSIHLPDVDESTGHVLVHYLHTGLYQTLNDNEMSLIPVAIAEFKRAVLAYTAANKYGLFDLQQLAKHKIECFGAEINIFDVVEAIKGDFSNFLCNDPWFHNYLGGKATAAFEEDYTVFAGDNFFNRIDDVALVKVMAKCVVALYNDKVSRMLNTEKAPVPGVSEECTPDVPDAPVEEARVKETFTVEETPAEECCVVGETLAEECTPDIKDSSVEAARVQKVFTTEETPAGECSAPALSTEQYPTQDHAISDLPVEDPFAQDPNEFASFLNAIGKKKGKKGKKGAIEEMKDEPRVDELPIPAPEPAPPPDDEWGTFAFGSTKGKKKKSKKCAKGPGIEEPSPPPPEPEPAPALAEEMKDNGWDSWTLCMKKIEKRHTFPVAPDAPKEELTVEPLAPKAVAEEKQAEDYLNSTSKGVEEVAVPEPEPKPVNGEDEGGERGFNSKWDRRVNKKKGKSAESKPAPVVDAMTIMQKTDGTVVGTGNSDRKAELDQPIEDDGEICPVRAKHLLGDEWKNCRQCRAILRQVAIQLALADSADEDGYMVVDHSCAAHL